MTQMDKWEPATEAEAAEMIRAAGERGLTVAIEGGGTKARIGEASRTGITLSTRRLAGITAYRPDEMVISARAGTSLAEIEGVLAEQGQRLAFEPIDYRPMLQSEGEPTIGAVAAINNSGPRRVLAGAARDSLLGVRFINGQGEIVRSGGRVMKNVTGLDLCKLLAGSWGTLGLMTEVTFKVLPRSETETTLVLEGLHDEQATVAMAHAMASSAEISGAAHLPELVAPRLLDAGAATLFRIEGFDDSVADRAGRLSSLLDGIAPLRTIDRDESRHLWKEIAEVSPYCDRPERPLWRISLTPSEGAHYVMALRMRLAADVYYDWQGGLVWLRLEEDADMEEIRDELARHGGGNALLVRASDRNPDAVPAFHPVEPVIARLNAGIRRAIDPQGVFDTSRVGF